MVESTRQREAFDRYWELGSERTIEHLHQTLQERDAQKAPGLRTLYEWSRLYHWQARLAEMERNARHLAEEARQHSLREMYARQAQEGLLLQSKGAEWLGLLDGEQVNAEAAIRAVVEGARLERLARGEPSDRQAIEQGDKDDDVYADFSDEELEQLALAATEHLVRAEQQKTD